ncbi:MAG: hypothetical protein OXI87_16730 [Albidovulum sp.]|nr:hypothetical protein [Albidovulum sp.]MDE0531239.1 hypothetical protein [Albidovulum sp.]
MEAIEAARCRADEAAHFGRLVGKGKKRKFAAIAAMRKLAVRANVLLRDCREWDESRPSSSRGPGRARSRGTLRPAAARAKSGGSVEFRTCAEVGLAVEKTVECLK